MRIRTFAAALLASWLILGTGARAQTAQSRANDAAYHEAIGRALQEFNLGHWTEAKVFFREAHARKPSARTLRGIGLACYESRNYVEAIDFLGQSLQSSVQPLTPDMRLAATKLIEQSRQFVMRVEVELAPKSAELFVDGKPVKLAADGSTLLDPGEHELSAIAAGYTTVQRRVNTEGGSERQLHFVLKPKSGAVAAASVPAPRPAAPPLVAAPEAAEPQPKLALTEVEAEPGSESESESDSGSDSLLPWLAIGGSVAVAATGGVLLGLGLSDKAAVEGTRDAGSWPDKKSASERSVPLQTAGGVLLGVGVAGLAASLAWQLWPSEEQGVSLQVGPGALTVRGRL
jgi:hypothetical protein